MSPERPIRTVGRCTVCGDMIVEVADVTAGTGAVSLEARIVRRCGCGDWQNANPQNANLAERKPPR